MQSPTYLHDLLASTLFTEGLDGDMDLWALEFSTIWIKGADLDDLAPIYQLDLSTRTPCHLNEILDQNIDDGSLWVAEVGDWISIMPATAEREHLLSITAGGREAFGLSMDIGNRDYLHYARDGRLVISFSPSQPELRFGDDPHALDHLMDGLRFQISADDVFDDRVDREESVSSALALIGRFTGTDIATDWFEAQHSCIRPTS
ncbi:DUF6461 domain-containing protein [Streptosporangium subroseum]|uniref:DUF6461 domain-containing protein n=1 Tax=Streptosporangium subroseum TaxID=106412 RepID=UPI0030866A07|nr:DUF6461 domain-containing protein [Streptosporangium subroseum]